MISKDSLVTHEFARVLFLKTRKSDFVSYSLSFIETEDNMRKIIEYVENNPDCSENDIHFEMVKLRK